MNINIVEIKSKELIYQYLSKYNNCFPESIDYRVGDLYAYSEKLFKYAYTFVAQKDSETLGIIILYANDNKTCEAFITMIAVDMNYNAQGIGSALFEKCEEICFQSGMKYLKLEVDKENSNAIRFYAKRGFIYFSEASKNTIYLRKELHYVKMD